jgi:hypothetical protein
MNEKDFMASVVYEARLHGWMVYHTYDSRRSPAGYPDLTMVRGNTILFWECKTDKKSSRLTPAQGEWLHALSVAGDDAPIVDARVIRPSDTEEIIKVLEAGL